MNIAIFASGSGSNAENIIRYFEKSNHTFYIFCNKVDAYVTVRAKNLNVPCFCFTKDELNNSLKVDDLLKQCNIDFIVLAGFLPRVPTRFIEKFPNKIVNIHPALLPKYGGKGMYGHYVHEAVVEHHETETGITIHYINEHLDEGAQIFQAKCEVLPTDTPDDVAQKVHLLEMEYFPKVIEKLINEI